MSQLPGAVNTVWVRDYQNPETQSSHPGAGGTSADPMGNCHRCGKTIHHEEQDSHNAQAHMGFSLPGTPVKRTSMANTYSYEPGTGFRPSYTGRHRA